jgi:hypothetical protein
MHELLADIERLEQAALRVPDAADDTSAPGARIDAVLEEARIQLNALMREALEMDEEIAQPELDEEDAAYQPVPIPQRPEPEDVLMGVDPAPPAASPTSAAFAAPAAPGFRRDMAARASEDHELREIIGRRRAEAAENPRRERRVEVESQGISIRVIPPAAGDAGGDGANRDVTLVFDLGPHQPPVRVSLPIDAAVREYNPNRTVQESPSGLRRIPMAVVGLVMLAMVMLPLGVVGAVSAGWVAPRPATATTQAEQTAGVRVLPAAPTGVELRVLREQPTLRAPILASIPNGSRVEVLDGAEIADGYHWIRVRAPDGRIGWLASASQGSAGRESDTSSP